MSLTRMTYRILALLGIGLMLTGLDARAQLLPSLGDERAGTSGFQFLKIPVDARAAALGQTVVASASDVGALYWNPALAANSVGIQAGFYHTAYFADVALDYAGVIYPLTGSNIVLGASLQTLDSGDMDVTTEFQPFGTGETFRLRDLALGVTFSQRLTDLFSYGLTSKYVRESVAGLTTSTVVFDVGFFYRVGTTGLDMAVSVRNFGIDGTPDGTLDREVISSTPTVQETEFEAITPPTTFHMGVVYHAMKQSDDQSLQVSAQLNNPNDNAENWNLGVEYGWNDLLFLRTGYRFGIEEYTAPSFGLGLKLPVAGPVLRFDYGFNRLERLGTVNRIGLNLSL